MLIANIRKGLLFEMDNGLVHIYCGDGKGKTTAAAGLAVRALGTGKKVLFSQFLKNGSSGEVEMLKKLGASVMYEFKINKFTFNMTDDEKAECLKANNRLLSKIIEDAAYYDLIVLDEIIGTCGCGLVSTEKLMAFLKKRPHNVEIVLTGRNPSPELCGEADYITEMKKVAHPYEKGIPARKGIEF